MVVLSVVAVEGIGAALPDIELFGTPLVDALNPYRAMLVVLYPESSQVGRLVWTSSLVYIGLRLIGAAALIAFGTFMLRIWNPGRNEPREQREGVESAPSDTLVEIGETETGHRSLGTGRRSASRMRGRDR